MKIVVHCENQVRVEVVPSEGQEHVAFTDIVASLEMAKSVVVNQWQLQMDRQLKEQAEVKEVE